MALDLLIYKNKVIKYCGKEYICTGVRKTSDRYVLETTTQVLALYYSQVESIEIIRDTNLSEVMESRNNRMEKMKLAPNNAIVTRHTSKKSAEKVYPISSDDIAFICENWSKSTAKQIANDLGVPTKLVSDVARSKKLVKIRDKNRNIISDEHKQYVSDNWQSMTLEDMAKNINRSVRILRAFAKTIGLPRKTRVDIPKVFKYDAEITAKSDVRLFTPPTRAELEAFRKEEETGRKSKVKKIQFSIEQEKHIIENWDAQPMTYFMEMFSCTREKFIRSIEHLGLKRKAYASVIGSAKKFSLVEEAYIRKHWESKTVLQIREDLGITRHVWNNNITSLGLKPKAKGVRERRIKEKVPRIFAPKKPVYIKQGRKPLTFNDEEKNYIKENWTKTTPAQIRRHLGYTNFAWNNRLHSVADDLPFKTKPVRQPRAPKRSLSPEELSWVRDAWVTKTTEEICDYLNVSYATFNKLVRALNFPRKKTVRVK